jgi:MoaA/NifB/PqqE/SkfB family radical SAM enzyme
MAPRLSWLRWRAYEGLNYRLRTVASGRWASSCRPASIIFLLTERCNARCVHCDIWKTRGKERGPSEAKWRTVLADLKGWLGPVHVAFSGGEALLVPYAIDLVEYARSIGLFVEVLTHGYWDDQTRIERLALANPWRITVSVDGIGGTHSQVRGRPDFWEQTERTLDTLQRIRSEQKSGFIIRLKHVIMSQNLGDTREVLGYAAARGMEVFYQPIEQNYNTPEDPQWFASSGNWPKDTTRAIFNIQELIALKRRGLPVANSIEQLEAMIPYFEDPDAHRISTQTHSAHEARRSCNALTTLQFQASGDVTVCAGAPPVGNVTRTSIRDIWEQRPKWWERGCCLEHRCSAAELQTIIAAPSLTAVESWKR